MSSLYGKGAYKIASQQLNLLTATVKVALVNNLYPEDLLNHEFFTDISAYVVGTPLELTSKIWIPATGKVAFDAGDLVYLSVPSGYTLEAAILYVETGVAGTSPLVARVDGISNFPYVTSGGPLSIEWSATDNRIFAI